MSEISPWWRPDRHQDRRAFLVARARIKSAVRQWFESEGFLEVEPGCLQISPGNETHLHAFKTRLVGTDLGERELYLHTSPEFACKKLLAAGETKIFTFTPVFRNRERGALHHPEFTMLEWYRVDDGSGHEPHYRGLWADCAQILTIAAKVAGRELWEWRGRTCLAIAKPDPVSVDEAFRAHAGIKLLEDAFNELGPDRNAFARAAEGTGIKIADDDTWSDIFSRVMTSKIEPHLGQGSGAGGAAATILYGYPICEAALARPAADDPRTAERFELYACGVELANGFGELDNAEEQRRRFQEEMTEKERRYGERYPLDEDFLKALELMPRASGCALGFDRLVMLATGARRIDDVIWTPLPM